MGSFGYGGGCSLTIGKHSRMNDKLITALLAIVLALGGWSLQRSFSLSQDMVVIKMKIEVIQNEISNFKDLKSKKSRKKKKKQGD